MIQTDLDGTVHFAFVGTEAGRGSIGSAVAAAELAPCYDDANLAFATESDVSIWFYNLSSTPTELTSTQALNAIKAGRVDIQRVETDCNQGWGNHETRAQDSYAGNTSLNAEVTSGGSCDGFFSRDGANVIAFGDLPSTSLGIACVWYFAIVNEITEVDIRLNKADFTWTTSPGSSGCSNRYDVESTAAHEVGHAYGQSHVAEDPHGKLTMSPQSEGPCQSSERTLGRGDWLGLDTRY